MFVSFVLRHPDELLIVKESRLFGLPLYQTRIWQMKPPPGFFGGCAGETNQWRNKCMKLAGHISWVKVHLCLLTQALIYGFGLLFLVGIMPEWGRWYSVSPYYSAQAESLLHGDLALSHNPLDLYGDLAWSEGGVQQPWGLGIPILRLPFHMCAKLFGYAIFPEHIATALLFSIVAFLVLKSLLGTAILRGATPVQTLGELGSIAVLLLFPPFIRLLRTRFFVYEEALAYTYLYGILEAVLLFQFLREPTRSRWIIAALVAGFGPWIRPTLIFYSVATWIVGTFAFFQHWKQPG